MAVDLPYIFPKISDITKIRVLIYRQDKYNLQTRILSIPDHEKFLKDVVVRLALFMNANRI